MCRMTKTVYFLFICLCCYATKIEGAKILGLFPFGSKSHLNIYLAVVTELAARNHDITLLSTYKPNLGLPNVKEVPVPELLKIFKEADLAEVFNNASKNPITKLMELRTPLNDICEGTLTSRAMKDLLNEGKVYDIVLASGYFSPCPLTLAYDLGKHVVLINAGPVTSYMTFPAKTYPSFVPDKLFSFPNNMNFIQRLLNVVGFAISDVYHHAVLESDADSIVAKHYPEALSVAEAVSRVSIVLVNNDPVMQPPHPLTPRVIGVGGMHLVPAKPLPKDIAKFVDGSGNDGFIIFSLGSIAPAEMMPIEIKNAFLNAFSRLKQRVIWKHKGEIPNLPKNVMLTSWMPQQDILGHPKCRLFIAHGGLLGLQEAIYHATPVLGIPLYGDQIGNMARIKDLGLGEELGSLHEITADDVYDAITNIIKDSRYKNNGKKYSAIMRDQPEKPSKRAAFWVEYVLRHDGAHHLKSVGDDQSFIQYYSLDVIGFLFACYVLIVWLLYRLVKLLFKICFKKKPTPQRADKKKK